MSNNQLTASQRASLFAQATRQNMQMLPSQSVNQGATTTTFTLPKARLLSKLLVDVSAKVKIKHASATNVPEHDVFSPYKLLRKISVDLNNGFSPYVIGGKECAMLNMVHRANAKYIGEVYENTDETNAFGYWKNKGASASGQTNEIRFTLELPITTNDRDPVGLILLQNDSTVVNLVIDWANATDMFDDVSGYTIELVEGKVTPMTETFSLPSNPNCFPDLSVLKLVNSRNDSYVGAGQHIIKLSTGTIYRRLIFRILDENGNPLSDDEITSPISLVFNQADSNYNIDPRLLRMLNTTQYGFTLPKGMYVLDFTYNGIVGLGGTRDLVDTERLTEAWLRFSTNGSGRCEIVSETLARLQ